MSERKYIVYKNEMHMPPGPIKTKLVHNPFDEKSFDGESLEYRIHITKACIDGFPNLKSKVIYTMKLISLMKEKINKDHCE